MLLNSQIMFSYTEFFLIEERFLSHPSFPPMRAYYNYCIHLFYVDTIHFVLCYLAHDLFKTTTNEESSKKKET